MHVAVVYDCLFPHTVGGAERWYRALADELLAAGHEVTYLTRRQWPQGTGPDVPGLRVVAVSGEDALYDEDGRRRIVPPLRFGGGVLRHLLRNRDRYDAVHLCAFPYFSLLAVRLALAGTRVPVGVDWFEVWSDRYWREYLGGAGGRVGALVQRLCARATPRAFVFSERHAARLREEGLRSEPVRLRGLYDPGTAPAEPDVAPRPPLAVYAGRHIPEKRVEALPGALAAARERIPELRAVVLGDGPTRAAVTAEIARHGLQDVIELPGFVAPDRVAATLRAASCLVLPSVREGYGLVVIEAAAHGTPSVVVDGPDNAAVELVAEGVNGAVAAGERDLADAIVRVVEAGPALRERTAAWYREDARELSAAASARIIERELRG